MYLEFARQNLCYFSVYTEDNENTIFRYRPYARKMDMHRLLRECRRHGFEISEPEQAYIEFSHRGIRYSKIFRTTVPWAWFEEPSFFSEVR